jgi:hypothetical protein
MKTAWKRWTVIAAAIVATLLVPAANATVQLTLTNGVNSVTVVDGGAGDSCAAVDCVTYSGAFGNYVINVSTGIASNTHNPFLDLNSVNVAIVGNAGLLTISTTQTGYTTLAPQFKFEVGGTSTLGGSSTFSAYGGNSNVAFDTSNQIGSFTFPTSPFSNSVISSGNTVNPYSLTLVAALNGVTAGSASFDAAINAVPEPASMALLGAVLMFAGSAFRRKLRRTV